VQDWVVVGEEHQQRRKGSFEVCDSGHKEITKETQRTPTSRGRHNEKLYGIPDYFQTFEGHLISIVDLSCQNQQL